MTENGAHEAEDAMVEEDAARRDEAAATRAAAKREAQADIERTHQEAAEAGERISQQQ